MAEIILSDETFESEVLGSDKPVIVDFFATWCGPCQMLAPTIEKIAAEQADRVKVCKMDVDKCPQTARAIGIQSIPTVICVKGNEIVDMVVGLTDEERILAMIDK